MAAPTEELVLIDAENNKKYKVILTHEDAEKARSDIDFANLILQEAKKSTESMNQCNASLPTNEPSTSTTVTRNNKGNSEDTEGIHIWGKNETLLLINVYSQHKENFHSGKCTMKQYWEKIAEIMKDKGYDVTGIKCSTKFQALKRTYKVIMDHNNKSGNNPKKWEYLEIMQELFSDKPWVQPLAVAGSHIIENEEKEDYSPKQCTKKRKVSSIIEDYILDTKEERQKRREMREKQHNEKMHALNRMENLMERILGKKD